MSRIRVDLESVQVIDGQGVAEGDFELRIQVQEGNNQVVWPALNSSAKVDKGDDPFTINRQVATYSVNGGKLNKRFTIDVTEVDKGTLGQDDYGQATLSFDLTSDMASTSKSATISLKRPNQKKRDGKVKVVMSAQQA